MPFIPHTATDVEQMLATLNLSEISQLFAEIPAELPRYELEKTPLGLTEGALTRVIQEREPKLTPVEILSAPALTNILFLRRCGKLLPAVSI